MSELSAGAVQRQVRVVGQCSAGSLEPGAQPNKQLTGEWPVKM